MDNYTYLKNLYSLVDIGGMDGLIFNPNIHPCLTETKWEIWNVYIGNSQNLITRFYWYVEP